MMRVVASCPCIQHEKVFCGACSLQEATNISLRQGQTFNWPQAGALNACAGMLLRPANSIVNNAWFTGNAWVAVSCWVVHKAGYCASVQCSHHVQRTTSLSMSASRRQKPRSCSTKCALSSIAFMTEEKASHHCMDVSHP